MSERSIRILLAVSLALNVFVLGAAAGAGYIWQAQQGQRDRAGDQRGLRFAAAGLSPDQRKAFRQALRRGAAPVGCRHRSGSGRPRGGGAPDRG
ncbi:periplasmic heavy metal sensor [Mesorhizobium sp.]|uniref:periplasmic heavy metal sensor n=1 Tax=Mesorhizobium sp. TaxID=1871066 RepID=UPI002579AC65|nr:periplasmic heavy metal sensor [Mesorhizobium sp.]